MFLHIKNFFNFKNKKNDDYELLLQEWKEEELKLPTLQEAISTIISKFTEEQLTQLTVKKNDKILTFEKRLLATYMYQKPKFSILKIEEFMEDTIQKYKDVFSLTTDAPSLLFIQICSRLFH